MPMKPIRVVGQGEVTLDELRAMFLAYMNAGAPEPLLEGTPQERRAILQQVAMGADTQMRALVDSYLRS